MSEKTLTIQAREEWRIWRAPVGSAEEKIALEHGYEPFAGYAFDGSEIVLLKKYVQISPAQVVPLKALDGGLDKAG